MSQVVILKATISAPKILKDLLDKMKQQDPAMAKWIENFDFRPLIEECARKAYDAIFIFHNDAIRTQKVEDYYGHALDKFSGVKFIGGIKTAKLPHAIGILIGNDGAIQFAVDIYRSDWQAEATRLQNLFKQHFLQQVTMAVMQILGYRVNAQVEVKQGADGVEVPTCTIDAVKEG